MAEKMKDSGISWIGEVPESWCVSRVRYLASICSGATPSKNVAEFWEGDIPWVSSLEVKTDVLYDTSLHISVAGLRSCSTQIMPAGTLVMVVRSGILQHTLPVALLGVPAAINQDIKAFRFKQNMMPAFFKYYVQGNNDALLDELIKDKSTVESVDFQRMLSCSVVVPPIAEQRAIASFLDRCCAQIDGIIADLERQIDLLKRYKKSLITETVTKGLDKNAPMKDSGVEWIGEIPAHWGVKKLKYFCIVKTGPFGTQLSADEYTLDGNPIINVKNIGYGDIIEDDLDFIPDDVKQRLSVHVLKKGDVVFGRKGSVDKHAIIKCKHDGWVQGSDCIRVRIQKGIEPEFLNYYFESQGYGEYVTINSVGSTMASVNSDILNNSVIVVPRPEEQKNIIEFLNKKLEEINRITAGKDNQLEAMKNYKQSLIYEYVTGKKRVKEAQPCPSEQTN